MDDKETRELRDDIMAQPVPCSMCGVDVRNRAAMGIVLYMPGMDVKGSFTLCHRCAQGVTKELFKGLLAAKERLMDEVCTGCEHEAECRADAAQCEKN